LTSSEAERGRNTSGPGEAPNQREAHRLAFEKFKIAIELAGLAIRDQDCPSMIIPMSFMTLAMSVLDLSMAGDPRRAKCKRIYCTDNQRGRGRKRRFDNGCLSRNRFLAYRKYRVQRSHA
jgi:hypothetical protein